MVRGSRQEVGNPPALQGGTCLGIGISITECVVVVHGATWESAWVALFPSSKAHQPQRYPAKPTKRAFPLRISAFPTRDGTITHPTEESPAESLKMRSLEKAHHLTSFNGKNLAGAEKCLTFAPVTKKQQRHENEIPQQAR